MKPLNKKHAKLALETAQEQIDLTLKLLLECWNHETPHFGGCGPHRYDGKEKLCCYCNRPKSWKPVNAGYWTGEILYGSLDLDAKEPIELGVTK